MELSEHTGINDHAVDLVENKQTLYGPIYSLGPVELENSEDLQDLTNGFIRPSKSPAKAYGCVNYSGLNNLTIKEPISVALEAANL